MKKSSILISDQKNETCLNHFKSCKTTIANKVILLLLLCVGAFVSCSEDNEEKTVNQFVNQVKENKYINDTLPWFSSDAIHVLLESADNFDEITYFPVNPLSSYYPTKLSIGECLLWTIENIRQNYGNYHKISFPSFVPELKLKNDINSQYLNDSQLNEVYNLYYNWWYNNTSKDFEEIRLTDPLRDSPYAWK